MARSKPTDTEIARWLQEARAGSQESLGYALMAYWDELCRYARRLVLQDLACKVSSREVAMAALGMAFKYFYESRAASPQQFHAWLKAIVRRQLLQLTRYWYSDKRDVMREIALGQGRDWQEPAAATDSPEAVAIRDEEAVLVNRALAQLSVADQEILKMRYWFNMEFAAIGPRIRCTEETARMRAGRAVRRLAAIIMR